MLEHKRSYTVFFYNLCDISGLGLDLGRPQLFPGLVNILTETSRPLQHRTKLI